MDPIADATRYRIQITKASSFSGDVCTYPRVLQQAVLSSSRCNASECAGYYNDPL